MTRNLLSKIGILVVAGGLAVFLLFRGDAPVPAPATSANAERNGNTNAVRAAPPDEQYAPAQVNSDDRIRVQASRLTTADPFWASKLSVPPDPAERIEYLITQVERGSAIAANELYMLAWWCAPWQPVPRTNDDLTEQRADIIQRREAASGAYVEKQDDALEELDRKYHLCRYLDDHDIPAFTHWVSVAADLGSHRAMVGYWVMHLHALENAGDSIVNTPLEEVKAKSIEYLERARDAGHVDAFYAIGAFLNGLVPGPYAEEDPVRALAHFYAESNLRAALIEHRESQGEYERRPALGRIERSKHDRSTEDVARLEHALPIYQQSAARELADEILRRCCT